MQGSKIRSFKNWDVTQFIILLIIKKLPPITIHFHNFLVFSYESVFLILLCFLFTRMVLNFHSFLLSCSPHISHLLHFQYTFDLWFVKSISEEKNFIKNLVKVFSSEILSWLQIEKFIHISQLYTHILNVERNLSKEKFNHLWKKNFIV